MTVEQLAVSQPVGRTVVGKIISKKMNKTVVVQVERKVKHPLYHKFVRRFSKMYAHDASGATAEGDTVIIKMCKPLSKLKHWEVFKVVSVGKVLKNFDSSVEGK